MHGGWKEPLVSAAANGDLERVKELLPRVKETQLRKLALEQASHHGHVEVVLFLLQSGIRSQAAFVRACGGSDTSIIKAYCQHCRINDGCTVGILVGLCKKPKRSASLMRKDVWATPMYWACSKGNVPAVELLLDCHAFVLEEDMAAASESGNVELIELLQSYVSSA